MLIGRVAEILANINPVPDKLEVCYHLFQVHPRARRLVEKCCGKGCNVPVHDPVIRLDVKYLDIARKDGKVLLYLFISEPCVFRCSPEDEKVTRVEAELMAV